MSIVGRKKLIATATVWLFVTVFLTVGCEPEEKNRKTSGAEAAQTVAVRQDANQAAHVDLVCRRILRGDFEGAAAVIGATNAAGDARLAQLQRVIDDYRRIEITNLVARRESLTEHMNKLEELRQKHEPDYVVDANEIGEIMSVVIRAREAAGPEHKDAILEEPFVRKVIATAIEKGKELDSRGEWIDAYAYCLYWLVSLDEDNSQYKAYADELSEKALIEMALKDDSCGQTSAQRHEGIQAEMVLRAVHALEANYVSTVDYSDMAAKGVSRCRLLGDVLSRTNKKLEYKVTPRAADKWLAGIAAIEQELKQSPRSLTSEKYRLIFGEILALNSVTIDIPEEVVIAQFAEASFASLDPYTTLVWPWQVKDFQKNMTQQFIGIGVEISKVTGKLKVVSLLPDTPAYTSGLDADDEIVAVDGESTEEMTIVCAVSKITGPRGTKVKLSIRHAGSDKVEDIMIVRDRIVVPPLRGWQRAEDGHWQYMIDRDNGIGYIRLTGFTETTAPDMEAVLLQLEKEGLKGLILDLRFNSGGYLVTAAAVVDMFVEQGMIVKSQPKFGFATRENARKEGTHPNYPLVVLINGQSASASEIVAGALQDPKFQRATLVGTRTYGKGSVQVVTPYTGGDSQLKYTMAYYHLPSGQRVMNRYEMERQGLKNWGIQPDVEVELGMNEMRKMIDVQRANEVLAKADHDATKPIKRHSLQETLDADKQLATAILVIKSKMIQSGKVVKFNNTRNTDVVKTAAATN
ncbi:MAG: S41 family peptidase [Phycisphaerae bacterium]|nr:S41 family peptidase [Phycisphaerae bacterium]